MGRGESPGAPAGLNVCAGHKGAALRPRRLDLTTTGILWNSRNFGIFFCRELNRDRVDEMKDGIDGTSIAQPERDGRAGRDGQEFFLFESAATH